MNLPWLPVRPGRQRLGTRLTRAAMGAAGIALLVAGLILNVFLYFSSRGALADDTLVQARISADGLAGSLVFEDRGAAHDALALLQASDTIVAAVLRTLDGHVFSAYRRDAVALPGDITAAVGAGAGIHFADGRLVVTVPVHHETRQLGDLSLCVSLAELRRRSAVFAAITAAAALLSLAVAYLLAIGVRRAIDRTEVNLDRLAYVDPVTGLYNRRAATEALQALVARHARAGREGPGSPAFGLVLLDLDDFSTINDSLGHAAGDDVLRSVAGRLAQALRPGETAYRFGGDEFLVIFDGDDIAACARHAGGAVMVALGVAVQAAGQEILVRGSAGIATCPHDAHNESELLRAADLAMYSAKQAGKNACVAYSPEMAAAAQSRLRIETELRHALERDEFVLHYQPIVALGSREIVGAEALLRWQHPERGLVGPLDFIDVAEASGLIVDIGQRVLSLAALQIADWEAGGLDDFYVAVNVSARQLRDGLLLTQVHQALAESGIAAGRLEVEITEHSLVGEHHAGIDALHALRAQGVRVAIDDFGTGLSSLAYLRRLPIDKLKIDRSFVRELPGNSGDAAIVGAIVAMARALGLRVVAEGVETVAQRRFLSGLAIDLGQGYLFSRPVPATAFAELLGPGGPLPTSPVPLEA